MNPMYGQKSCTNLRLDTHIRCRISEPSAGFRWYFHSLTSKSVKLVPPESWWFMLDSGITPSIELKHLHPKILDSHHIEAVCKSYIRESLISSLYPPKSFLWYVPELSFWALSVGVLGFQRCFLSGIYLAIFDYVQDTDTNLPLRDTSKNKLGRDRQLSDMST